MWSRRSELFCCKMALAVFGRCSLLPAPPPAKGSLLLRAVARTDVDSVELFMVEFIDESMRDDVDSLRVELTESFTLLRARS